MIGENYRPSSRIQDRYRRAIGFEIIFSTGRDALVIQAF